MPYYPQMGGYQPIYQYQHQQPQQQTSIIWVDYNEAMMYPVAPNAAVQLWDRTAPIIYLKKADATGKPSMQIFDLVERKEAPKQQQTDNTAYATQEQLSELSAVVDELRKGYEEMRLKSSPTPLKKELKKNE